MNSDQFPSDDWSLDLAWDYYARAKQEIDSLIEQSTSADVNPNHPDPDIEEWHLTVPVGQIDSLIFLSNLLNRFSSTAYGSALSDETEISPVTLSKVIKGKGFLAPSDAISLLDRLKTLLFKIENEAPEELGPVKAENSSPIALKSNPSEIPAEKWSPQSESAEVGRLIDTLTQNLEDVVQIIQRNNSLAELEGVSLIRLNRLKAVLKTALVILEAPLVETGLLKKASELASEAGKEFAKDELKKGMSSLLQIISDQALELYIKLTMR